MNDLPSYQYFPLDFHLSAKARWEFNVEHQLDKASKESDTPKLYAARLIAQKLVQWQEGVGGARPVYASEILAMGLLSQILRYVVDLYCVTENPASLADSITVAEKSAAVDQTLKAFVDHFPPEEVVRKTKLPDQFKESRYGPLSSKELITRELALLSIALENGALEPYRPLFDDSELQHAEPTAPILTKVEEYFGNQPPMKALDQTLFEVLRAPMKASPFNLEGQLQYILENWEMILPERLKRKLLLTLGMVREETISRGHVFSASPEALSFKSLDFFGGYPELERFSEDADWMSNYVLMAKNVYVWLDQLSKKYQRSITRLDQIPDEELDCLIYWGFSGLWLIGLWQRSPASQKIKQIMGNPEAVSSAYSLFDYVIAEDLGGENALRNLTKRAGLRGIRLASDMVPNHVGLFSKWVVEHPEWFIRLDHPPFPNYQFTGPNLSEDSRISLYIEDGYWSHSDAAVVFKRVDNQTGDTCYIYHGNDGTHMPWNDTAQLDYLNPELREAAIQTILHVARNFPAIRFDAAMTLAKKHYHRLWFPLPGEGGAIPSRAEHGMNREEFDRILPREFWIDVVDRVTTEAPDTLLLAEAFWFMEGYFVRTLGMHRVYNSAFMNMLKMEDNANYRTTIKNVLEFSPEVLKRFVNFMNNPDERTAVDQFGKGDKYFGVAVLLATMPGLPMFGHGQIEGFAEKYGMEYRKAYWDESIDYDLVQRHEAEIFPLLKKRRLFSGSKHFALYDFYTPEGWVDENVFAYSNRAGNSRACILYNNAYNTTSGWIHTSTSINVGHQDQTYFIRKTISDALQLRADYGIFYIFRDSSKNLEYLRKGSEISERGLYFDLMGYQYYILLDWREIHDTDGTWAELERQLEGRGVPDIAQVHNEMVLSPLITSFRSFFGKSAVAFALHQKPVHDSFYTAFEELSDKMASYNLLKESKDHLWKQIEIDLDLVQNFAKRLEEFCPQEIRDLLLSPRKALTIHLTIWALVHRLTPFFAQDRMPRSRWIDDWFLASVLQKTFTDSNLGGKECVVIVQAMIDYADLFSVNIEERSRKINMMFSSGHFSEFLELNWHEGTLWFSKEKFKELLKWCLISASFNLADKENKKEAIQSEYRIFSALISDAKESGYRVEEFLNRVRVPEQFSLNS